MTKSSQSPAQDGLTFVHSPVALLSAAIYRLSKREGLTLSALLAVTMLAEQERSNAKAVSAYSGLTLTGANHLIEVLITRGLIVQTDDQTAISWRTISLTEDGQTLTSTLAKDIGVILPSIGSLQVHLLWLLTHLREEQLTFPEHVAMFLVSDYGKLRVGALGRLLGTTLPATSRLVAGLAHRRLLVRREDPRNRSSRVVHLSTKGRALVERAAASLDGSAPSDSVEHVTSSA